MIDLDDSLAPLGFDSTARYTVPENPADAALESVDAFIRERTCHVEDTIRYDYRSAVQDVSIFEIRLSCGHTFESEYGRPPRYCSECGAKVVQDG